MKPITLHTGWTCRHLDQPGPGQPVTIPHDAMLAEPRTKESPGGINTGWFEGHDYRYVRQFDAPEDWKGWCGVAAAGVTAGFGKCSGGRLKNHYPKGLRNLK